MERPNQEKKSHIKLKKRRIIKWSLSLFYYHTHTEQPRYIGKESLLTLAPIFFYYTVKQGNNGKKRGMGIVTDDTSMIV